MNEELKVVAQEPKAPNHRWNTNGSYESGLSFKQYVEKTWYNRFKWWVATKLFLPGDYEWINQKKDD